MFVSAHSIEFFFYTAFLYCIYSFYSRTGPLANSELLLLIVDHNLFLIFSSCRFLLQLSCYCAPHFQSSVNLNFHLIDIFCKHYFLTQQLLCLIFYFPEFWLIQKITPHFTSYQGGDTVRSILRHTRKRQKGEEMNDKQIMKAKNVWRTNDTEERWMKNMRK